MAKPVFPNTTVCGQLFNDFLIGKSILSIYSKKGKVSRRDQHVIVIRLYHTEDCIHLSYRKRRLYCIEYETTSVSLVNKMGEFLDTHFEKDPAFDNCLLHVYNIQGGRVFVSLLRVAGAYYIGLRIM